MISAERLARIAEKQTGLIDLAFDKLRENALSALADKTIGPDECYREAVRLQTLADLKAELRTYIDTHLINSQS